MSSIHVITYDGKTLDCPVCVHPERHEIEVMMQSGRSNQDVGERYGFPAAHVAELEGRDPSAGGGISQGEFIRRHRSHLPPRT